MRKHIIGLILFSFIVSAAVFIYVTFNNHTCEYPNTYTNIKTVGGDVRNEMIEDEINSPVIMQAVFNAKTKKLSWKLASLDSSYPTVLHWFLEDEKGIQSIDAFYAQELSGDKEISSYNELGKKLSKLSGKSNMYIIADTKMEYIFTDELNSPFEFDSSRAVPVTIDYGK